MVQSLVKNQSNTSPEIFISELADIQVYETRLIEYQCWQVYAKDLSTAAQQIRELIKK